MIELACADGGLLCGPVIVATVAAAGWIWNKVTEKPAPKEEDHGRDR